MKVSPEKLFSNLKNLLLFSPQKRERKMVEKSFHATAFAKFAEMQFVSDHSSQGR